MTIVAPDKKDKNKILIPNEWSTGHVKIILSLKFFGKLNVDFSSENLDQFNLLFWLLIFLLIFANSADFDGCRKLIKRKEKNITFFDIPEINLRI